MDKQTRKKNGLNPNLMSGISIFLCLVFGFILVCNITIIVKGSIDPDQPPSVLGITPMVVLSGSMSGDADGHIEIGDLIFVSKVDVEDLKTGDVIAFKEGAVVVTHRIVEIQKVDGELRFVTKGDANNANDRWPVTEDRLLGICKARIPQMGNVALFLQTPLGMVVFIGLPLVAFVVYDIIRRQAYTRKEIRKTAELEAELDRLRKLAGEEKL